MKKRKTIIAAIVLLCVFLVGGAIAYFTDTDTKTNTFTIGNVDISLSEPNWVATNGQNVMPKQTIVKDPIITNDSTTNPAFVFAEVTIPCTSNTKTDGSAATPFEIFTLNNIGSGWNLMTNGSCTLNTSTNKYEAVKVYNYGTASAMTSLAASTSTPAVFGSVTVSQDLDGTQTGTTGDLNVVVNAYGIQTTGLENTAPTTIYDEF